MNGHSAGNRSPAAINFHLANAWQLNGEIERAIAGYRRALGLDPDYVLGHVALGNLLLKEGRTREALECYERALTLSPGDPEIARAHGFLKSLLEKEAGAPKSTWTDEAVDLEDNPEGKINLRRQLTFLSHRSGWNLVVDALRSLHNSRGVLFDGFIENNFAWQHWQEGVRPPHTLKRLRAYATADQCTTSEERGITPYLEPWVGILHNPQGMPTWFNYQDSPQTIFAKDIWQKSVEHCLGLFSFSEYHAAWVREQTGRPVSVLTFPTEIPEWQFGFDRFMANPSKQVVQIGWWLRRLNAIYQLPLARGNPFNYRKTRLVPNVFYGCDEYMDRLMAREREVYRLHIEDAYAANTGELWHLPNDEYDELLSQNIVFLYLYDASANNAVVECIARATPVLVNPIPAVVESLGPDYPFYFQTLEEAAEKALNAALIERTHVYLKACDARQKLEAGYFLKSFAESEVYRSIGRAEPRSALETI